MVHASIHGLAHGSIHGSWFMVHSVHHNVPFEHGALTCIFPCDAHFDIGHHHDTQWYLWLLSEPLNNTQTFWSLAVSGSLSDSLFVS